MKILINPEILLFYGVCSGAYLALVWSWSY